MTVGRRQQAAGNRQQATGSRWQAAGSRSLRVTEVWAGCLHPHDAARDNKCGCASTAGGWGRGWGRVGGAHSARHTCSTESGNRRQTRGSTTRGWSPMVHTRHKASRAGNASHERTSTRAFPAALTGRGTVAVCPPFFPPAHTSSHHAKAKVTRGVHCAQVGPMHRHKRASPSEGRTGWGS